MEQEIDYVDVETTETDTGAVETESPEQTEKPARQQETPEAKLGRLERQAAQLRKRLGIEQEVKTEPKSTQTTDTKSTDLDWGQKAFLRAEGIKGAEETKLVTDFMENTGKSLEDIVDSKFFQAELKELREAKASAEATPSAKRGSPQTAKSTVDYWLDKDTLPEDVKLRREVVNAKIARSKGTNPF